MFNLFGKKSTVENTKEQEADKVIRENLDKEIIVHVMPKLFLNAHTDAKKAKSTGILILISGAIFLVAAGFGFYYFIFKYQPAAKTPAAPIDTASEATTTADITAEPVVTPTSTPALVTELATTTTTSTGPVAVASSTAGEINLIPAKDSDQDGLTDNEEALLGTDPNIQDTDGDGFNDLAELIKLYNPTGAGKITDNTKIKVYTSSALGYSLDYPTDWTATALGEDTIKIGPSVVVNPEQPANTQTDSINTQFIQVNVSANTNSQEINDWYKEQFNLSAIDPNNIIQHFDAAGQLSWQGVKSPDGLTVYLTDKAKTHIYTINYDLSLGATLNFPNIFNLALNSFNLTN